MSGSVAVLPELSSYSKQFQKCVTAILTAEGYFSSDQTDPGGTTKYGIAQASHPNVDIENLTRAGAISIYYNEYYHNIGLDLVDFPLALHLFDMAVNQGQATAMDAVQTVSKLVVDGRYGAHTAAAMHAAMGNPDYLCSIISWRISKYVMIQSSNPASYLKYHNGWFRRVAKTTMIAQIG